MFKFFERPQQSNSVDSIVTTEQLGEVAGRIWHVLSSEGETTIADLVERIAAPRDVTMQGIGWLAREGKIQFWAPSQSLKLISEDQIQAA